jgi:hypothetical protein
MIVALEVVASEIDLLQQKDGSYLANAVSCGVASVHIL